MGDAPVWLIGPVMVIAFPLAVEAGYRFHALSHAAKSEGDEGGAGYIVSAALALLGLLIGFTFSMSSERYETRRHLVVDEANAISTTWLREQLLDEGSRGDLAPLMRDYVQTRQAFAFSWSGRALAANEARTQALQQQIWTRTAAALREPAAAPLTTSLLQTTNDMFDLAATRRAARDAKVPAAVLWALIVCAATGALIMGYGLAAGGRRHLVASSGLFALIALSITLIVDLDQPRQGSIQVSTAPMDRVAADIRSGDASR